MEKQPLSAGEQKIQEYMNRIQNGESKDSIFDGLSPSFIAGIETGLNSSRESNQSIDNEGLSDTQKSPVSVQLEKLRAELGISQSETGEKRNLTLINEMVNEATHDKNQAVKDLYKNFLDNIDDEETRKYFYNGLFGFMYNKYRIADYEIDLNEEQVWENTLKNQNVEVNNKKPEWMYRGQFPQDGQETSTRGSFNVHVTPEIIEGLDDMISSGKIKANYKFGQPGTSASPTERHDAISIYFLEEPSEEAIQELSQLVKPFVRGDNLLGKRISEGFFMSEIGSIKSEHISQLIDELTTKDFALAKAIKTYTTPRQGTGDSLKMSEAQYYSVKDVAHAFGYDISYNTDKGFGVL